MKFFLFLLLIPYLLLAESKVIINNDFQKLNVTKYIYVIEDKKNILNAKEILHNSKLQLLKYSNQGFNSITHWSKLIIKSNSTLTKKIIFENPRAGMDFIDVYIFKNQKIINSFKLGHLRPIKNRSYKALKNNFAITLQPNEEITIISRLSTRKALELGWDIYSESEFLANESFNYSLLGFFIGFIITLIIFTFYIYKYSKQKFILIYILFLLNIIFLQMVQHGAFHLIVEEIFGIVNFDIYLILGYISSTLFNLLWYIFILYFFNLKESSPHWRKFFLFIIWLLTFYIVLFLFSYINPKILLLTPTLIKIALIHIPMVFIFLFWSVYKKFFGSVEFLLATASGKLMFLIRIFNLLGDSETSFLAKYGILLSGILSALFLALALIKRISKIQIETIELKEKLQKQEKFKMIASSISFIAHQWRQPLTRISSIIMNLHSEIEHHPTKNIKEFEKPIDKLNDSVEFINQTISDIQNLFQVGSEKSEIFLVSSALEKALGQSELDIETFSVDIQKDIDKSCKIRGDMELLKQALFSIIQNAIEIFKERKIKNPTITIIIECKKNGIVIKIEDNGGGVTDSSLDSIFKLHFSHKSNGTGLGLSIVKQIIELKFHGSIFVENSHKGATFTIII